MATDGVKIIDSDTANDIYSGIMDLYDNGATLETIKSKFTFPQTNYNDAFDYEIYVTSYALAMWEIGAINNNILQEVKQAIEKGACVKTWTEEVDIKTGIKRQKELDKFWKKINAENLKIRKRKKYRTIKKFFYNINDVLAFQLADNNYYVTVLLNIKQFRGKCRYEFGKILYKNTKLPTINEILDCEIIGRKIPSGIGMNMKEILAMGTEEMEAQGGIEAVLKREAERTGSWVIGMSAIGIDHKNLINITNKFVKIGTLHLKEKCTKIGSWSGALDFENLTASFKDLNNYIKVWKMETFQIKDLIKI